MRSCSLCALLRLLALGHFVCVYMLLRHVVLLVAVNEAHYINRLRAPRWDGSGTDGSSLTYFPARDQSDHPFSQTDPPGETVNHSLGLAEAGCSELDHDVALSERLDPETGRLERLDERLREFLPSWTANSSVNHGQFACAVGLMKK